MFRSLLGIVLVLASAARGQVTPDQVEKAIERGTTFLYARQAADGSWENSSKPDPDGKPNVNSGGQWGGTTALAVYALLSAGENRSDPKLARAIEFLRKAELIGVYAVSLRVQVWSKLPQTPENKQFIRDDVKRLMATLKTEGAARGFHDYIPGGGNSYSHSRANYAVLGLWTAAQCVDEIVPDNYWKLAAEAWMRHQDPSGGWRYKAPGDRYEQDVTPGMTAAGVATLFIAQDFLFPEGNTKPTPLKQSLDRGLTWLGANFSKVASDERFDRDFPYITLYGIERVALASGLRYIGEQDWYEKFATWLIARQRPAGGWHRDNTGSGSVADTSFAIITLARGRAPIAFSKLDYSGGASSVDWNTRPRDIANVTRYVGRQMERDLNWQIVRLDSPTRDWHDAAVLYLAGGKALALKPDDKSKLRQYVENGGLVLCSADVSSRAFGDSVRKLGLELFPGREWRELPADHPIYTAEQFPRAAWRSKPQVLALSNGVRELMILLPLGDPGRWWQSNNTGSKEEVWQLAANIQQYAAGRDRQRLRGQSPVVESNDSPQPDRTVRLARLKYNGNWDPEPGGWRRIAAILHNRDQVHLDIQPAELGTPLDGFSLAHLTGTDAVKLDAAATEALKNFVDSGGTLLVDAAGGSTAFAAAVESALAEAFPGESLTPLPDEHPMLSSGGNKIEIAYRSFARSIVGAASEKQRLLGLQHGGRTALIFSREDLSAGMLGTDTDGIVGYAPATATEMVRSLVLSAAARQD